MTSATYDFFYRLDFSFRSGGFSVPAGAQDLSGPNQAVVRERKPSTTDGTFGSFESVEIDSNGDGSFVPGRYVGTITFNGTSYPVFASGRLFRPSFFVGSNTAAPPSGTPAVGLDLFDSTPVCFLPGTLIATPIGERPIETLAIGDLVSTPSGPQPVKFVGRSTRILNDLRATGRMPIRIRAAALGAHGPARDTYCTPSHALLLEGHLVEAGALVNAHGVEQLTDHESLFLTYHSIELERHDLIRANGLEAETYFANFRSSGFSRESWDNYAEYVDLYGPGCTMEELPMPRIPFARQLPMAIRLLLQLNEQASHASCPAEAVPLLTLC